jgi:uracil-DNA glycosylase family 4
MMKILNEEQPGDRETQLALLHQRILACRLCQEHGYIKVARPLVSGRASDRMMVIGQAPGRRSIANGRSFSGPGGITLQKWLEQAGFPPGYLHEHTYLTSLTRCDPGPSPHGEGDRRPSPAEIALCRPFLEAELRLIQPKVILLVGSMAIEAFFGEIAGKSSGDSAKAKERRENKLRLEDIIGTFKERDGMLLLPLPHPSGLSRWLLDPQHQQLHRRALEILSEWRIAYGL